MTEEMREPGAESARRMRMSRWKTRERGAERGGTGRREREEWTRADMAELRGADKRGGAG